MATKHYKGKRPAMAMPLLGEDSNTATTAAAKGADGVKEVESTKAPAGTPKGAAAPYVSAVSEGADRDSINYNAGPFAKNSKPDVDAARDSARKNADAQYTPEKQGAAVDFQTQLGQSAASPWMTAAMRTGVDPFWNINQAWQDKYGNLNKKGYDSTLALSRLADTINSRYYSAPSQIGTTAESSSVGGLMQLNPIETQEMRQMRSNEAAADLARQESIKLQSDTQRIAYDAQRLAMNANAKLAETIGLSEVEINRAWQNAIMQNEYTQVSEAYWREVIMDYGEQLAVHMAGKKADIMAVLEKVAPAMAAVIQPLFASGIVDYAAWREFSTSAGLYNKIDEVAKELNLAPAVVAQLRAEVDYMFQMAYYTTAARAYGSVFTGTAANKKGTSVNVPN